MDLATAYSDGGWSDYPDERGTTGMGMGALGAVDPAPLVYMPSLADVGHGSGYYPGSIMADAHALNFLGYIPDDVLGGIRDTTGSIAGDQAAGAGAWDPNFQQGIKDFQGSHGDTVDGWVGPQTRASLATAVAQKNAQATPIQPPYVPPAVPPAPGVPVVPPAIVPPTPTPVGPSPAPAQAGGPNYLLYGGIALGVAAILGIGYYALSD